MERDTVPSRTSLDKPVFSFDGESNGLWGASFAIGALIYNEDGDEIDRFAGRLPDEVVTDTWVIENVLPQLGGMVITHGSYDVLLADFAEFYLRHKDGKDVITHIPFPVEFRILSDMHSAGLIGDFEGPLPLLDISTYLRQAGEDPLSVDDYAAKHGLLARDFGGGTHNPLYDSEVAYTAYRHLILGSEVD